MNDLIAALTRAVEAAPHDVALLLHLANVQLDAGLPADAITTAAKVLQLDAANAAAHALILRAVPATASPDSNEDATPSQPTNSFDWTRAEREIASSVEPPFVAPSVPAEPAPDDVRSFDVERSRLTLADVGGMAQVKERLEASFLAPLRNPELRRMYGKSLRGGLLMYGPPGCGKTFIARALAGELQAGFMSLGVADVVDGIRGETERNIHAFFAKARRSTPVVVFIDELDTLGQRRTTRNSWSEVVNQLLTELDGVEADNEGLYILGATNQPWMIDPALRRPGRLDRTVLVLPPDAQARAAIFRHHLDNRPVAGIHLDGLAARTEGLTGADIAHVCETASEHALMESVRTGVARHLTMSDLETAITQVRPSIGGWLESARNVVAYGEDDGTFGDLKKYLKSVKRM